MFESVVGSISRFLIDKDILISLVTGLGGGLIVQIGAWVLQAMKNKSEAPGKEAEKEKTASETALALIEPYKAQVEDMEGYVSKLSASIDSLRQSSLEKDEDIFELKGSMDSMKRQVVCLETEDQKKLARIAELEDQIKVLLAETEVLKELLDTKDEKILAMQGEIDELRAELEEYKKIVEINNIKIERKRKTTKPSVN